MLVDGFSFFRLLNKANARLNMKLSATSSVAYVLGMLAITPNCAYNLNVRITFDPRKNEWNIRERDLSFELAAEFDFDGAYIRADSRHEYGQTRYIALGMLRGRLHVLCSPKQPMEFVSSASAKPTIER